MEAVVDRIEKEILVLELEDGTKTDFPKKFLPEAKEGDVITFFVNKDKTENRKKEMDKRVSRLWKD